MLTDPSGDVREPRVFVSYSHESEDHREAVLRLCDTLRAAGIDAWLDRYDEIPPPPSWPAWMHDQMARADFVVLVCTEAYQRRLLGQEQPGLGRGAAWEGGIITQEAYESSVSRFIPVLLGEASPTVIPYFLKATTHYRVDSGGESGVLPLIRHLLGQPEVVPPPLGARPVLRTRDPNPYEVRPSEDAMPKRAVGSNVVGVGTSHPERLGRQRRSLWRRSDSGPAVRPHSEVHGLLNEAVDAALNAVDDSSSREASFLFLTSAITAFRRTAEAVSSAPVRVTIIETYGDGSRGLLARTLLTTSPDHTFRGAEGSSYPVDANLDLSEVLARDKPWSSADVSRLSYYRNSHLNPDDSQPYRSVLVVPVKVGRGERQLMLGFLALDSRAAGALGSSLLVSSANLFARVLGSALLSLREGPR